MAQRCFAMPELVALIAEDCLYYHLSPKAVATLARTSRSLFYECARVLWHTQRGVENLVRCLPADLWEVTSNPEVKLCGGRTSQSLVSSRTSFSPTHP